MSLAGERTELATLLYEDSGHVDNCGACKYSTDALITPHVTSITNGGYEA